MNTLSKLIVNKTASPQTGFKQTLLASVLLSALALPLSGGAAQTESYTYNAFGLIATMDGKRTDVSDITAFAYDTSANLISVTNALGHITQITSHDLSGRPLTLVDANGAVTTLTYDVRGRLLSQDVAGNLTQYSYDATGNILTVSLSNGEIITYHYDSAHRPIGYSDALGNKISYTLDAAGNQISETITDPDQTLTRSHQSVHDELSRLRQDIGANSQTATFDYDVNNNQTNQTDPNNNPTNYAFDALDRLITTTDAALGDTDYIYDDRDNLTGVIDPNGNTTSYAYDAFDNLTSQTSPDTGSTAYTYDDAGNRLSQTDARGVTTTYTYDALNRLITTSFPDSSLNVAYTYDENGAGQNGIGRLTSQTDASGMTDYVYDLKGNIIQTNSDRNNQTYTFDYSYNSANQLTQMSYPDGRVVDYQYDLAGRLIQVDTTDSQSNQQTLASNMSYQPFGPMTNKTYGNGLTMTQASDLDYRQTDLTTPNILERGYSFDANSNITNITDNITTQSQAFSYDNLDRLTQADDGNANYGDTSYLYDPTHNRTNKSQTLNSLTEADSYSYPLDSNKLANKTGTTVINYQYDANGNIIDNGTYQFSYGDDNRLHTVSQSSQILASYTYNAQGQRTQKVTQTDTTYFLYGQQGELLAELDNQGGLKTSYQFANGQLLAMAKTGSTATTSPNELILDNTDAVYSDNWPNSTSVQGFYNTNYQFHAANNGSTGLGVIGSPIDNLQASYSDNWPNSTSVQGFYNANYQYHAGTITTAPGELGQPLDNLQATYVGNWPNSTSVKQYYGSNYQFNAAGTGTDSVTWATGLTSSASYDVYVNWSAHANRASNAKYTINHSTGNQTVVVNQKQNGGQWQLLGTYTLDENSSISLSDDANGYVIADGVTILPAGTPPVVTVSAESATWDLNPDATASYDVYASWTSHSNRASNAQYTVSHAAGNDIVTVNQKQNGNQWNLLGTYTLDSNSTISLSSAANGYVIADSVTILPAGTSPVVIPDNETAQWTPAQVGEYQVYANWTAHANRASNAKYTISHTAGNDTLEVNQQQNGGDWQLLGTYTLDLNSTISLSDDANGYVIADGIRLVGMEGPTETSGLYYVHNDHLGTPQTLTDENQSIVWQAYYTPFGEASLVINTVENNIRFPGQYYDSETGLHYNYFRYYDPSLGRYITSDPIGLAGGINTFTYVGGNPLSYTDPTGEFANALLSGLGGAALDLAIQYTLNGGRFECIKLGETAVAFVFSAFNPLSLSSSAATLAKGIRAKGRVKQAKSPSKKAGVDGRAQKNINQGRRDLIDIAGAEAAALGLGEFVIPDNCGCN